MKRVSIGIDGNCISVGLGQLYEDSKFIFEEILNEKESPSLTTQKQKAYEKWCNTYPEEGRLPFDLIGL